jgi:hypothetical protein
MCSAEASTEVMSDGRGGGGHTWHQRAENSLKGAEIDGGGAGTTEEFKRLEEGDVLGVDLALDLPRFDVLKRVEDDGEKDGEEEEGAADGEDDEEDGGEDGEGDELTVEVGEVLCCEENKDGDERIEITVEKRRQCVAGEAAVIDDGGAALAAAAVAVWAKSSVKHDGDEGGDDEEKRYDTKEILDVPEGLKCCNDVFSKRSGVTDKQNGSARA